MDFRPYSFGGAPLSPGPGLSTYPFPPSAYAGGRTPVAGGAPSSSAHGAPQSAMRRPAMASASARLSTGNNPSTAAASAAAAGLGGAAYPAASSSSSSSSSASSGSTGFSVAGADDMVNGRLQWKNIQSIVRATFGNVFAQLRSTQVSGGCGEGRVCVCVCVCWPIWRCVYVVLCARVLWFLGSTSLRRRACSSCLCCLPVPCFASGQCLPGQYLLGRGLPGQQCLAGPCLAGPCLPENRTVLARRDQGMHSASMACGQCCFPVLRACTLLAWWQWCLPAVLASHTVPSQQCGFVKICISSPQPS